MVSGPVFILQMEPATVDKIQVEVGGEDDREEEDNEEEWRDGGEGSEGKGRSDRLQKL